MSSDNVRNGIPFFAFECDDGEWVILDPDGVAHVSMKDGRTVVAMEDGTMYASDHLHRAALVNHLGAEYL